MLTTTAPTYYDDHSGNGYFAGSEDGIVTVGGQTASREIICFDADSLAIVRRTWSLANGHYLVPSLNPNRKYLLMCRDHKNQYKPDVWDYRPPSQSLDLAGQQALIDSWAV